VYLVDGAPAGVTVAPNAPRAATALEVTGPDFFMKLSGVGDDSDPLGLTPKNALILQSQQTAARSAVLGVRSGRLAKCVLREPLAISSGNGFMANSPVKMYILPATYIGTLTVDDAGAYQGSLPIPAGLLAGSQTLQANGFAPSGAVRSLSLGIMVKRGRTVLTKSERANVFFDPMSPVISPEGKAKLDVLVKRATRNGVRTVAIGFVQETPTTSNDESLSTQRARNVAAYLRSRGLAGAYVVRGDGIAGPGATARRVNVTVSYQTGC
jgi:outer membrane protein OmpA-like peptidoglycan-associated protein